VTDFILDVRFDSARADLEELVDQVQFTSAATGSVGSPEPGSEAVVSLYFNSAEERSEAASQLRQVDGLSLAERDQQRIDWLQHYEQSLEPMFIGSRFVVAPAPHLIEGSERLPIIIPQEEAFGTGSHETTSMCLEMLESLDCSGVTGVDIGTGTGILAIGMSLLGARRVFAFDNDVDTIGTLRRDLARNAPGSSQVVPFFGTVASLQEHSFDLGTMNILAEVIAELFPSVAAIMKERSALVLSGILISRRDLVLDAATAAGYTLERELTKGEWWCGLVTR
jgi:ribosomal protein L11 methyltransferase